MIFAFNIGEMVKIACLSSNAREEAKSLFSFNSRGKTLSAKCFEAIEIHNSDFRHNHRPLRNFRGNIITYALSVALLLGKSFFFYNKSIF